MYPDRGILRIYRRSDGLSTRPEDHNTLTPQSTDMDDAPWDSLHGPVTGGSIEKWGNESEENVLLI